jgi:hypothetical protein
MPTARSQNSMSGLVARLIQLYGIIDEKQLLKPGKQTAFIKGAKNTGKEKP